MNLASRLSDEAQSCQVLIDRRTRAALGDAAEVEPVGPLALKGFDKPVPAFLLARGEPSRKLGRVEPGFIAALAGPRTPDDYRRALLESLPGPPRTTLRRAALAEWLTEIEAV